MNLIYSLHITLCIRFYFATYSQDYLSFKPLEPLDPVEPQTTNPDADVGPGVEEEDVVENDDSGDAGNENYQE